MIFTGEWNEDLKIMQDRISKLDFKTSSTRKRLLLSVPKSIGGSMLWGSTFRQNPKHYTYQRKPDPDTGNKLNMTQVKEYNPDLKDYFNEFRMLYFPDFDFNSVQINKNYITPPHLDSRNVGESVLIAMGDYKGGDTCLFNEKTRKIEKYDARKEPLYMDGSTILHWVSQYKEDDRYSLVFFNGRN